MSNKERTEGIAANLAAATSINRDYRYHAEASLAALIRSGAPFNADDVRAQIPSGIEPHSDNVLPSVIGAAAARKQIVGVDRCLSRRRSRHGSRLTVWVGA